ncbi:MAG: DNA polymerase domain-containing protein, partial [Nitrososphaeraceae archaeon]
SFPSAEMPRFVDVEEVNRFRPTDPNAEKQTFIELETSGRILADYMVLYRKYEASEKPSYKLSSISEDVLVDDNGIPSLPKLEYAGSLQNLYEKDLPFFIRYNIRDSEILHGFETKLAYTELANQMYHLSCGLFQHVPGTLKLAELAIVNYCHHVLKQVVNDNTPPEIDRSIEGALVLLPQTGLHEMVGSIDINSLYPTAIRSTNASIETLRGQFIEDQQAWSEIFKSSNKELTLVLEKTKEEITATANEWREFLLEKKWAISGYGTVFDQEKMGILPAILADWFAQRKIYQGKKKDAEKKAKEILDKYKITNSSN